MADDSSLLPSQQKFKQVIDMVKQNISKEQESISAPVQINLPQQQYPLSSSKSIRRSGSNINNSITTDFEQMYYDLQQKFDQLYSENLKYKEILRLRQEIFIKRELQMREKETELNNNIEHLITMRSNNLDTNFQDLKEQKFLIEQNISQLQDKTHKIIEDQSFEYEKKMQDVIKRFKKQLERERSKSSHGEREWLEQSRVMQQNLETTAQEMIKLDDHNNELMKENQKLKIQFKAQEEDREIFTKKLVAKSREIDKLKNQVQILERELQFYKQTGSSISGFNAPTPIPFSSPSPVEAIPITSPTTKINASTQQSTTNSIKWKQNYEQEHSKYVSIKNAHVNLLTEQTEIHLFLKQCIEDVKMEVHKRNMEFGLEERNKVIQLLLSKERVLQHLLSSVVTQQNNSQAAISHYNM